MFENRMNEKLVWTQRCQWYNKKGSPAKYVRKDILAICHNNEV